MSEQPRRFFGLLCAHQWGHWGTSIRTYANGGKREIPTLRCVHCGEVKVAWK